MTHKKANIIGEKPDPIPSALWKQQTTLIATRSGRLVRGKVLGTPVA